VPRIELGLEDAPEVVLDGSGLRLSTGVLDDQVDRDLVSKGLGQVRRVLAESCRRSKVGLLGTNDEG